MTGNQALSVFTFLSRYARRDLGLLSYPQSAEALFSFYRERFSLDQQWLDDVTRLATAKALFPAMRSVQFQPVGFLSRNERLYNCAGILIDNLDAIWKTYYLLLCGCGVGFNISKVHVEKLPKLVSEMRPSGHYLHVVEDSVLGWAKAADALIRSYIPGHEHSGLRVVFDYSGITPKGTLLRSCGRPAPGHEPLERSLERVRQLLNSRLGKSLRPVDVYDIICILADSVMAGGVRRSALIAIFDRDDDDMLNSKTGDWYAKYPWRSYSNNSVIITDGVEMTAADYKRVLEVCLEYGEPGFVHVPDVYHVVNPCVEIVFRPVIDGVSSYQFCNLVEVCVSNVADDADLELAVRRAAEIGALQAQFTNLVCPVAKALCERERLVGLSLTGLSSWYAHNGVWRLPQQRLEQLRRLAALAVESNTEISKYLGARPAARVTCIKPSGTVSCLAGSSSGIHPWYAARYIRNVVVHENDPVYQLYQLLTGLKGIPHPYMPNSYVIGFPVEANSNCNWSNVSAVEMLDIIRNVHANYVAPGVNTETWQQDSSIPRVSNSVSCTVLYSADEIPAIAEMLAACRRSGQRPFVGISFLPRISNYTSDIMPFLPADSSESAFARWQQQRDAFAPVSNKQVSGMVAELFAGVCLSDTNVEESPSGCDNELCVMPKRKATA
jgi:ribonucleoside-diphosphate reductase alpha chain